VTKFKWRKTANNTWAAGKYTIELRPSVIGELSYHVHFDERRFGMSPHLVGAKRLAASNAADRERIAKTERKP
jgi:hypothetical protein